VILHILDCRGNCHADSTTRRYDRSDWATPENRERLPGDDLTMRMMVEITAVRLTISGPLTSPFFSGSCMGIRLAAI
jgi:hypothetical protein